MSVLTKSRIKKLIEDKQLVISPILDIESQIEGGSVNIRLGTKFIVTKKSEYVELDPATISPTKIKKFQTKYDLTMGQKFVLHPRQLVLSSTLEFIKLPENVCANVFTRSSYGRIGLIIATAAYVHPNWRGCLTLELFNYGDAPIPLRCGCSIGQLVLYDCDPIPQKEKMPKEKVTPTYIRIGPIFADMTKEDWPIIKAFEETLWQGDFPEPGEI